MDVDPEQIRDVCVVDWVLWSRDAMHTHALATPLERGVCDRSAE